MDRPDAPDASFEYVFPAIRGVQAGREFFVSMCPLRLIPKLFLFDEDELLPEMRAQRSLNRDRLPEIASYITRNPDSYVFSSLTASIDGEVRFDQLGSGTHSDRVGVLRIAMDSRFVINDGQHRRAAIDLAMKENPELAHESISVVFFKDAGLRRSQQMFADLNRHASRASRSIGVLYDHRDPVAEVTRRTLPTEVFDGLVERESSSLSSRSRCLFTLSALYGANTQLLHSVDGLEQMEVTANRFWSALDSSFPEWKAVRSRDMTSGSVRKNFLHSHAIALHAFGVVGRALVSTSTVSAIDIDFAKLLEPLGQLDWRRTNSEMWDGRAMVGGQVAKGRRNELLTAALLLKHLQLPLTEEQRVAESAFESTRSNI